jgi:hypothetical protein
MPHKSRTAPCAAADGRTRLGCRHRGDDHRSAAELLRTATPDGAELAKALLRLDKAQQESGR